MDESGSSPPIPAYPIAVGAAAVGNRRKVESAAFWLIVICTAAVSFSASSARNFAAVQGQVSELDAARSLGEPELVSLATGVAFVLAGIISTITLGIFFSLCRVVDQKVLPGTSRRIPLLGRTGPAVLLGLFLTLPVSMCALVFDIPSPKDTWPAIIYAVAVAGTVSLYFLRPHYRRLGWARTSIALSLLTVLTLLSYAV